MAKYVPANATGYEADTDNIIQSILGNGVAAGMSVTAQSSPNMTVQVAAGVVYYGGVSFVIGATASLAIAAADPSNPRVDIVHVTSAGTVAVVTGTPAPPASLAPPALPSTSIMLAYVTVAAAAVNIQNSNISPRLILVGGVLPAGTAANRPAATSVQSGAMYFATDTAVLSRSNGATWTTVATLIDLTANPVVLTNSIAIGTTPAASGVIRIPNNTNINARNAANNADVNLIALASDDALVLGAQRVLKQYAAGNTGTALTLDWNNGDTQTCTATGNVTFTLNNPVTGRTYIIKITQDATGTRTYTWPAAVKWSGGTAPVGSGANKVDVISLYWDGTNYFGSASLNY